MVREVSPTGIAVVSLVGKVRCVRRGATGRGGLGVEWGMGGVREAPDVGGYGQ